MFHPDSAQRRSLHWITGMAGFGFAVMVMLVLNLEARYALAGLMAMLFAAAGLALLQYLPELLLGVLAFNLPFTGIEKTFFQQGETTFVAGGVSIGLAEICTIILYVLWFGRIFVTRVQPVPVLRRLDWCVFVYWMAHTLSVLTAVSGSLALVEVVRLAKYALVYFYVTHNLTRRSLRGVAAGICFALVLQTGVAAVQYKTGKLLGVGQTKGAAEKNYDQYTVDGFENVNRAEGTTFDSHALGLFCAMALTVPLVLVFMRGIPTVVRLASAAVLTLGIQGLVISFARAAWAAFAAAAALALFCIIRYQYRDSWRRFVPGFVAAALLSMIAIAPFVLKVRQRIVDAPPTLITARIETVEIGLEMWKSMVLTGVGPNNYMRALELKQSIFEGDPYFIPAHNMFVFILVELGVLGILAFVVLAAGVVRTGWRAIHAADPLYQGFGAAMLAAFVALNVEGISDPIYATNVTYFLLWFQLGILSGVERLASATTENR